MSKMTIVFVKATGHVVGALTRRGDPEGKLDPATYLAGGMVLRNPKKLTTRLVLAPEDLGVEVVDLVEDALANPLAYYFDKGDLKMSVAFTAVLTKATVNPPVNWAVKLTPNKQTIWIQMDPVPEGKPLKESAVAPDSGASQDVAVPMAILPGAYNVVVLVTGLLPHFEDGLAIT